MDVKIGPRRAMSYFVNTSLSVNLALTLPGPLEQPS